MRMGMKTLRQAGLAKVKDKITTLEEITRTTMPDFFTLHGGEE
jgi:type II secretory ATPase GspE/PulE/Tfp pilus assembly ATPase PilB-like protein